MMSTAENTSAAGEIASTGNGNAAAEVRPEPVIKVSDLSVELPVYTPESRNFRRSVLTAPVGGALLAGNRGPLRISALKDLNFELGPGHRMGLLGHNGAGKTTLLRVLAGVYTPTSGKVIVRGAVSNMFDVNLGMDREATGRENVYMLSYSRGLDHKHVEAAIGEITEFAGLGPYLDLPVKTYSSGMASRLAFAVATSFRPDVLLMDEWISTGDAEFVERAEARLQDRIQQSRALVLASHNVGLIERVCTQFLILSHGQIAMGGHISQLREAVDYTYARIRADAQKAV